MSIAPSTTGLTPVDIWVDPRCPWAWITSRWLLEAEQVRALNARFHIMSLSVLNEGREVPEQYRQGMIDGWACVRVCVAARQRLGDDAVRPLYLAMGRLIHHEKAGLGDAMIRDALTEAGLPADLIAAADDTAWDAPLRAEHHAGMDPVGSEVGTPVIHVPGPDGRRLAFFGPVLTPAPRGEEAGRLWDAVLAAANVDGFFELKRGRDRGPQFE
ncbi:mycothiol-dependent nitroreductase Rv2466c family protein [Yinghuangia soli]|uniref:Disulfide bond formation protein DsbA n=1 Tax=Yinghuangia soli TaxID=2908204 RepID=A0AA41Q8Q4_9ACTN|nr:disulfide bond formation protein DsbA [Yinghuangia soli]MCF2533302.1 disulfide bond formation protein DsbA [Yinghuangia soli]